MTGEMGAAATARGRWLRRLAGVVLLMAGTGQAAEPLPFADETGLVHGDLRYSHLVTRLGEPPAAQEMTAQDSRGAGLLVAYPALGLAFRINAAERPKADPLIAAMLVRRPWVSANPRAITKDWGGGNGDGAPAVWQVQHAGAAPGLRIGMSDSELLELAVRHYRIRNDYRDTVLGEGGLWLVDKAGEGRRHVWVTLQRRRVATLEFSTVDAPWLSDGARKAIGAAAVIAAALAFGGLWVRLRGHRPTVPAWVAARSAGRPFRWRAVLAEAVWLGAVALGVLAAALLRQGGDAARLVGLLMIPGALGLMLVAMVLFAGAEGRRVAVAPRVLLGLLFAAFVAWKLMDR